MRLCKRFLKQMMIVILSLNLGALVWAAPPLIKLTVWTHERHNADLMRELIKQFNQTVGHQKKIELALRVLGDDSWQTFQKAQSIGEGPDLYSSGFDLRYPDSFRAGAKIWFDDFPDFKQWKKQWPEWYWIEGLTTYHGHVYAFPYQVINSRLIYNRDLFRLIGRDPKNPPRSYAEVRQIALQITKMTKGKAFGFAYCGKENWPMEWMPSQWAEANGEATYWDWQQGRWAFKGYFKVFQLILQLYQDGSLFPGAPILTNDALRAQFAEGRIGMFMGETWDVGVLNDQFPAKCDWAVAAIPTYDGEFHGKPRAMLQAGLWCINAKSRHQLEAWEVVKWFSRYQIRAKFYERGKSIDPDPKVRKYVKHRPTLKGFEGFAETSQQDYLATYPYLLNWKRPEFDPCMLLRSNFIKGGDLRQDLIELEIFWNKELDNYYRKNPEYNREWNIYPNFDRITGKLGQPQQRAYHGLSY